MSFFFFSIIFWFANACYSIYSFGRKKKIKKKIEALKLKYSKHISTDQRRGSEDRAAKLWILQRE
jgi:hypothetical protein